MSEVRKGTSRNTENENKRCKIFNKVLNMNWDYVRGKRKNEQKKKNKKKRKKKKKKKKKINKQKGNKQKKINKKKIQKKFIRQFGSVFNKKKWLNP
jgi:hypothetical protein